MFSRALRSILHGLRFRIDYRRLSRTAFVSTCATFAFQSTFSSGQEAVLLFNSNVETPFLAPAIPDGATENEAMSLDPIEARFQQMQQELDALKASLDVSDKKADAAKKAADKALAPPAVTYPTAKLTGFFQADAGWFHQDAASLATPQLGDIQDD